MFATNHYFKIRVAKYFPSLGELILQLPTTRNEIISPKQYSDM